MPAEQEDTGDRQHEGMFQGYVENQGELKCQISPCVYQPLHWAQFHKSLSLQAQFRFSVTSIRVMLLAPNILCHFASNSSIDHQLRPIPASGAPTIFSHTPCNSQQIHHLEEHAGISLVQGVRSSGCQIHKVTM